MKTITTKFGGSSLADAGQFRKVAQIIADPSRRYIIVSAPGKRSSDDTKVTDLLYRCCDQALEGGNWQDTLERIRLRYESIRSELGVELDLDAEIAVICDHLSGTPSRDYMASRGEYLNAKLLAAWQGLRFCDAAEVIRFRPDGTLDGRTTESLLSQALAGDTKTVIPGFYGAREDGSVQTFSRGGSDVTGSLVAAATRSDLYENWTDVSGMLFTDPRIIKDPIPIEYITYRELRELSYMGASVLHEDAVFPARRAAIPINIRNTNRPEDPGTMIVSVIPQGAVLRRFTGVAGKKGFSNIRVEKSAMNSRVGFGAALLDIFAAAGVPFEHCPTGIDTISVVVSTAQFRPKQDEILQEIRAKLRPDEITVEDGLAMIAVVGNGMISTRGVSAQIFGSLADAGINIRMIDQGSDELNIIIGVDETDFESAIGSLYHMAVSSTAG